MRNRFATAIFLGFQAAIAQKLAPDHNENFIMEFLDAAEDNIKVLLQDETVEVEGFNPLKLSGTNEAVMFANTILNKMLDNSERLKGGYNNEA